MKILWTEPAAHALESIQAYIAQDNRHAAYAITQKIKAAVAQLANHPKLGRAGRVRKTYELVIPGLPYIVPYRIKGNAIQILTVFHAARKWPSEFE